MIYSVPVQVTVSPFGQRRFLSKLTFHKPFKREHKRLSALRRVRSMQDTYSMLSLWRKLKATSEKEALKEVSTDSAAY